MAKKRESRNEDGVPFSTIYYHKNKEKIKNQQKDIRRTLNGKLTNLITTSRYRCKLSGLPHSIDTEYLKDLYSKQEGLCAITGKVMIIRGFNCAADSPLSISLDRIDSDEGYVDGNVWLVCTGINLMKSRLKMTEFVDFCKLVSERFS
jgi:hypothetical protein